MDLGRLRCWEVLRMYKQVKRLRLSFSVGGSEGKSE